MFNQASSATSDAILSEHFINGRLVGLRGEPSSLVQGRPGTREHQEAMRGWHSGARARAYEDALWSVA